jgi:CRISPR/Cas system CSM-associated protein Csm4 (group 5 of RAMP superfamily)
MITEDKIKEWKHLADKSNWRITQLPNGYFQTEVKSHENSDTWMDITRRETVEGAEAAIDGSIEHFTKRLEFVKGPKVVKTF